MGQCVNGVMLGCGPKMIKQTLQLWQVMLWWGVIIGVWMWGQYWIQSHSIWPARSVGEQVFAKGLDLQHWSKGNPRADFRLEAQAGTYDDKGELRLSEPVLWHETWKISSHAARYVGEDAKVLFDSTVQLRHLGASAWLLTCPTLTYFPDEGRVQTDSRCQWHYGPWDLQGDFPRGSIPLEKLSFEHFHLHYRGRNNAAH